MKLTYNGDPPGLKHIPARDLDDDDLAQLRGRFYMTDDELIDMLTSTGLYSVSEPVGAPAPPDDEPFHNEDESEGIDDEEPTE